MRTVVLVHGAWHGAWCWDAVVAGLNERGVESVAVDLPSVNRPDATLHDDADHVLDAIEAVGGPVVLVGHSYGGVVVTDASAHPAVEHVVFITAFPLADGETVLENNLTGGEDLDLAAALEFDDGVTRVRPELAGDAFFHDCGAETEHAIAALRPMSMTAMTGTPRTTGWRGKPTTFALCTEDRALPPALQRSMAARTDEIVEWPASHSPFLSRPDLVVELLTGLAEP